MIYPIPGNALVLFETFRFRIFQKLQASLAFPKTIATTKLELAKLRNFSSSPTRPDDWAPDDETSVAARKYTQVGQHVTKGAYSFDQVQ